MNTLQPKSEERGADRPDKVTGVLLDFFTKEFEQYVKNRNKKDKEIHEVALQISDNYLQEHKQRIKYEMKIKIAPSDIHLKTNGNNDENVKDAFLAFQEFVKHVRVKRRKPPIKSTKEVIKSPLPLRAFDYMGHNKLDITSSEDGYALLFEKR